LVGERISEEVEDSGLDEAEAEERYAADYDEHHDAHEQ
jgi:hypothetical protein